MFGDALPRGATRRATASELREAWTGPGAITAAHTAARTVAHSATFDGYFAGVAVRGEQIVLGGDLMGLFPLYVAARGDVYVASSTPAVFASHPAVDCTFDVDGLVSYLLTGGPFDGRTVQAGVRRVAAGALAKWRRGGQLEEVTTFRWPSGPVDASLSFHEQLARFDAAQADAVRRHTGVHERINILLSGGRDSRTLAGYLAESGRSASTITLGAPTDHDVRCAAGVARALGMPHAVRPVPFDPFVAYADRCVEWERHSVSMSSVHTWAGVEAFASLGGGLLSGYMADVRHLPPRPATREAMLQWAAGRAIAPDMLTRLLRAEHRPLVAEVMARVHAAYDALGADEGARGDAHGDAPALSSDASWRWFMAVYMRFHAGAVPWRLSFGAWPVMPIIDQAFLEATLSIPLAMIANRTMQDAVLRTRFPALARVPLDRNAHDTRPLVENWRSRLASATQRFRSPTTAVEQRFYVRMYDFDNPGWRAIRESAEPGRTVMTAWFDADALASIVPSPSHVVAHADPIAEGFGPKMLTGLMRGLVLAKERSR
ncbi:MAG: hypothetical protein IT357_05465 [Gemmatimonadaceae bacterium]|nr:hypothetical protein [Gemmatimonadaceae bacterium]